MTDPRTIAAGLTANQQDALHEVCRSNGGGVNIRCRVNAENVVEPMSPPFRKLFTLGLIQGKAGGFECVVHTRDGLAVRAILQEQDHAK